MFDHYIEGAWLVGYWHTMQGVIKRLISLDQVLPVIAQCLDVYVMYIYYLLYVLYVKQIDIDRLIEILCYGAMKCFTWLDEHLCTIAQAKCKYSYILMCRYISLCICMFRMVWYKYM